MAAIPLKIRGLNAVLVAFSLLVLGGSAYYMEQNLPVNLRSGASNVIQSATGKLVKKGTPDFSPCKSVTTNYALIGAQPETPVNAKNTAKTTGKPSASPTPACTPLSVQSSIADSLLGQKVIAEGTLQNGIFYATSLKVSK